MTYSPNYFFEALRGLLIIAGWYVLFYLRHRPASNIRRAILLICFPVCYTAWRIYFLSGVRGNTGLELFWVAILLLFALLCGDLRESLFTAIYYIGIEASLDTLRNFIVRYNIGGGFPTFSPAYYAVFSLLYLSILGWALFYCWVLKNSKGKLPLRFWILTVIPPIGTAMLITRYANMASPLLEMGINTYLEGILIGLFLLTLNLFTFYMYIRLLSYYESHLYSQSLKGQLDLYARQIKSIEIAHERTQIVRHEMKNLLLVLQAAITEQNYEEALKRLGAVLGEMDAGRVKPYTGIPVIDMMLSYKAERLQPLGASFEVNAAALEIPEDTAYDIASMAAIMLDNAIDAASCANFSAPFSIRCNIQQENRIVLLTFRNPLHTPLNYKNNEIVSTKPDSGHRLGLPSLRRLAEKYQGSVQISDLDDAFTITVLLFVG